ncbi:MAG: isoaspartyl peptidase/L-asparaginase [Gemmatimonadota bacterium]
MTAANRREFLRNVGLLAGVGAVAPAWTLPRSRGGPAAGPLIRSRRASPVVISSANGLRATERAMALVAETGDTLEGVVSGVNIVESDPADYTVGYGGLPNADGVVQLDSQVWHGPTRGAGAVAALEGYRNPSRVAVAVMRYTDHVLLVGRGAARFAREFGFEAQGLLTEESRRRWLAWRARLNEGDDYLMPEQSGEPVRGFRDPGGRGAGEPDRVGKAGGTGRSGLAAGRPDRQRPPAAADPVGLADPSDPGMDHSWDGARPWGTIHCAAVNAEGEVSAVTTTSGLFFKVPGRVGDSPLPGCGCYCDNDVGAAGSTGRGEAVIKTVGAHAIVEEMRRDVHPTDACLTALRRIVDWTVESRLLREDGRPSFNVNYYAVNVRGEHGAAALWSGSRHAVHDGKENRHMDSAYLFDSDR